MVSVILDERTLMSVPLVKTVFSMLSSLSTGGGVCGCVWVGVWGARGVRVGEKTP